MKDIKDAIQHVITEVKLSTSADDILHLTQAILNLAHAQSILTDEL